MTGSRSSRARKRRSARDTVAELYRCRWEIEVFFKQLKQTLQLGDFPGQSANAVRWQVWMALLAHVLLRFVACASQWGQSYSRLWTLIRAALWKRLDLIKSGAKPRDSTAP